MGEHTVPTHGPLDPLVVVHEVNITSAYDSWVDSGSAIDINHD